MFLHLYFLLLSLFFFSCSHALLSNQLMLFSSLKTTNTYQGNSCNAFEPLGWTTLGSQWVALVSKLTMPQQVMRKDIQQFPSTREKIEVATLLENCDLLAKKKNKPTQDYNSSTINMKAISSL